MHAIHLIIIDAFKKLTIKLAIVNFRKVAGIFTLHYKITWIFLPS